VKNEAAFIEGCLLSLDGQVDEIVVVDTGSTDGTQDIVRRFNCKLLEFEWQHDFSAARNFGLNHAKSDWILYIDADERLTVDASHKLGSLLRNDCVAYRIKFQPRTDTTYYDEMRLFRCDPRIRFSGSMHETMIPAVQEVAASDGLLIANEYRVAIRHLGYDGSQLHKHERNIPLLETAIQQDPSRVYLRFHLGYTLDEIDRLDEASVQLQKGIQLARNSGSSEQVRMEGSMCAHILCMIYLRRGSPADAIKTAHEGLELYSKNTTLQWALARALLADDDAEGAIALLHPLLVHDPESFFDPRVAYAKSLFLEDVPSTLGAAYFKLERFADAAFQYECALAANPDNREYKTKLVLCRAKSARR